jgi:hypothetical protein
VGYWQQEEFGRLDKLADRGIQAVAKLQRYLRSARAKRNAEHYRNRTLNLPNDPDDPNDL